MLWCVDLIIILLVLLLLVLLVFLGCFCILLVISLGDVPVVALSGGICDSLIILVGCVFSD